ncbi:VCBS repeat-containing protein [bacterium]|nr:VCBS repeat-containing protein [bacterium]MDB4578074.1 VCBS repeat-containing protein [Akkermansiaceae bacterium]
MRFLSHLPLLTSALFLTSVIELAAEVDVRDQVIKLRLKEMARADRLPIPSHKDSTSTAIPVDPDLPSTSPGSIWSAEKFSEDALAQLKRLSLAPDEILTDGFLSSELESTNQGPPSNLSIHSGTPEAANETSTKDFLKNLRNLGKVKFKVTEVDDLTTRHHVEANREGAEYSATWTCLWNQNTPPALRKIQVEKFETVFSKEPWFQDATLSTIGFNPRFDAQVMHGIEYWSERITRIGDLAMSGHHGLAVGDVNGDGLEDLYVCDGGSLPNQLYLQQPDGTAKEVAAEWSVAWLEDSRSALLVDLDNDGDQDLVVATIAMIAFAENIENKKFQLRGGFPGAPYPFSLSAADFDNDGDLDIYTCVYSAGDDSASGKRGFEATSPVPFNDAENGGRNVLLANLGDFKFGDFTQQVGLDQNNTRWSFAASWEDFDRDGDPDLYVANDFGRNCFYRNDKGTFTNIAPTTGVEDMAAGMSVSWGDYNRDGQADLLIGNMFSSAGRRVAFQRDFDKGKTGMARGNSLFSANEDTFQDVSISSGITNGGWAWSSGFADLNNDGWQDLVVANGYLTNTRDDDL